MSLITKFHLNSFGEAKHQTTAYKRTFIAGVILTPVWIGLTKVLT